MFKNYFKIALRTLRKQAGYSLINVGGLGLGLACCFLIVLFIQHELSFDGFHAEGDRIYRLTYTNEDDAEQYANSAAGFAPVLEANFPGVEHVVRIDGNRSPYLRLPGGEIRRAEGFTLADPAFFEVFSFPLLRGNPETALADPRGLVLTERTARALFGDADPMGRTVGYGDDIVLTVTGVAADVPSNSHLQFDYLGSFLLLRELAGPQALENFTNINYMTYVLLRPGVDPAGLEEQLGAFVREEFGEDTPYIAVFQPLADIYFNTGLTYDIGARRGLRYVYVFGAIGLLVLLIACVNFMNLATARATQRAKEVGVRKAIGAYRSQLVGQFLGESVILSVLAIVVAVGLAVIALPVFNEAIGGAAGLDLGHPGTVLLLVGIGLLAGVVAGSYPAFYLSAFRPAHVLKGEAESGKGAAGLRKGLIVFQFAISAFLIVATFTVYDQLHFMRSQDLGFNEEQVLFVSPPQPVRQSYPAFKQALLDDPRILTVAQAGGLPGRTSTSRGYNWPGQGSDEEGNGFWTLFGDPDYLDAVGIELREGRAFSWDMPADTQDTYLLNETAVRMLGWEDPVGHPFRAWDRSMGTVIGVVKDFHFQSLHQEVQPVVINYKPWFGMVAIRIAPGDVAGTLAHLRETWQTFAPGYAFDYTFLDEDFERLYRDEARLGQLFGFFAGVAIFIACLGLFGLAAFTAERRRKEIGVRKVLGASVAQIVLLLSKDFARLVLVALAVAVPLAWFAMSRWLDGFAYRVELGPGLFLLAGALALVIALLTVSYHAVRAASLDPVKALRYE